MKFLTILGRACNANTRSMETASALVKSVMAAIGMEGEPTSHHVSRSWEKGGAAEIVGVHQRTESIPVPSFVSTIVATLVLETAHCIIHVSPSDNSFTFTLFSSSPFSPEPAREACANAYGGVQVVHDVSDALEWPASVTVDA